AGMVNVRQRPGSANGVIFMTIEDESGDANVIVWEKIGEQYKQAVYGSSLILITGLVQREGDVVHLIARSVVDLSHMLADIGDRDTPMQVPHQPGDEFRRGGPGVDPRVARAQIQHRSRDFK
ncbi:MAG TPA: OB-fold nucleic acid binding domain-containing protein, partial [Asticcacaulis sp.]|nr:OB-fold nucleic acid binding domain-containing protein [Asticcacaulis sp.]